MKSLANNIQFILIAGLIILSGLLFRQCESTKDAKNEVTRLENNTLAYSDSLKITKDRYGNTIGEKRALELKLEEVKDSLEYEKNKPPVTIVRTKTIIKDRIKEVPVVINDSTISLDTTNVWGKSSRNLALSIPYAVNDNELSVGNADITLNQDIWLEASLLRDPDTKESFIKLKTDYPGVTFNNSQGILISGEDSGIEGIEYNGRKTMGVGFLVGYGYGWGSERPVPIIGVGLYYSPKFLQW